MAARKRKDPPLPRAIASYPQPVAQKGHATPPDYIRGRVILFAEKANITVTLRNFELPQVLNERTGGWQVIERPEEAPVLNWTGYSPVKIRLTLLADGLFTGESVEPILDDVRSLTLKGQLRTPPSLIVIGKVPYARGIVDATPMRWVVDDPLDIEELEHLAVSGNCCRAKITMDLLAYTASSDRTTVNAGGTALTKRREHRWTATDTLHDLAEHYLGDASRFNSIRSANPRVKSFENLRPGTIIYIPSKASVT